MRKKFGLLLLLLVTKLFALAQQDIIDLAERFSKNGEYSQAINVYKKLHKAKIDKSLYYKDYLNALIKVKDYDGAEKLVYETLKTNSGQIDILMDLGYLFTQKGDKEKAQKIYESILKNLTADESNISAIATEFYNRENYDYAIKTYLRGRELLHNNSAFLLETINLYKVRQNKYPLIADILSLVNSNPDYINLAKNNLAKVLEGDKDYNFLKLSLLKILQKEPDNYAFADLLAWQYLQQKDFKSALVQTIALDKRYQQDGSLVLSIAEIFTQNKDFLNASKAYQYLLSKGKTNPYYVISLIESLNNKKMMLLENDLSETDLLLLQKDYLAILTEYGKNGQTLFAVKELANLQAYYLNNPIGAQNLLENALQLNNIGQKQLAEIKMQLGNLYLLNNNIWDAALMYGQVERAFANEPMGQEAKLRNAKLSFYNGDFKWAKSQLDVLKASTSQLIANDALDLSLLIQNNLTLDSTGRALKYYASADKLLLNNNPEKALSTLDSIKTLYPKDFLEDDASILRAKIFVAQRKYLEAANQYQSIIMNKGESMYIDDALFLLAQLQEQKLNLPKEAENNYQTLINNFSGSPYVGEARERFRILRGDVL